ncbi:hypothetical protein [Mucilaginibacter sp. CSA2-8R]|uniref:hypothetical protein n=1 Tax=Mucilaginibacter sp. CSA2-8R TaxID=3141542 RepID=UPI00315C8BDE
MPWSPITYLNLQNEIREAEKELSSNLSTFWNFIRIEPEKWNEEGYGEEGNGFWVVAIMGKQVIWYNDIEDGFNVSLYFKYGVIEEYACNQLPLNIVLLQLWNRGSNTIFGFQPGTPTSLK